MFSFRLIDSGEDGNAGPYLPVPHSHTAETVPSTDSCEIPVSFGERGGIFKKNVNKIPPPWGDSNQWTGQESTRVVMPRAQAVQLSNSLIAGSLNTARVFVFGSPP